MRLATLRTGAAGGQTTAARIDGDEAVLLDQFADVGAVLAAGALDAVAAARGPRVRLDQARFAPVVPNPGKIICVGMNYRAHVREMGRTAPPHPALFAKWKQALIGAGEAIQLPPESKQVDWEGELAAVVGKPVRRADLLQAADAIAGYTIMCDTSMRDWQYRSSQWMQGKTWEKSTPLGPWLATPDELGDNAELTTKVDGQEVQRAKVADLVVGPAGLVAYISTFITLEPGDVVATGTPGGVGHARRPPVYLKPGQEIEIAVTGLGALRSFVANEPVPGP
jgi:acylpyruvate hydrolase